jgi:hypothetical protein
VNSERCVDVIKDDGGEGYRAELRLVDSGELILAGDWRPTRAEALADARALRNDDDKLAILKQADVLRGGRPAILRDRGDVAADY